MGEHVWDLETIFAALESARERKMVILGGDVLDDNFHYIGENWYYEPVYDISFSRFSKINTDGSYIKASDYVNLWKTNGNNVYFTLVLEDVMKAYIQTIANKN